MVSESSVIKNPILSTCIQLLSLIFFFHPWFLGKVLKTDTNELLSPGSLRYRISTMKHFNRSTYAANSFPFCIQVSTCSYSILLKWSSDVSDPTCIPSNDFLQCHWSFNSQSMSYIYMYMCVCMYCYDIHVYIVLVHNMWPAIRKPDLRRKNWILVMSKNN